MSDPPPESLDWSELGPLLDQALDLEGAERETWIAGLESTRPQVAAGLRRMLAEREALDARGFLAHSPFAQFAPSLAGIQAGAYTIERLIGRGGMGEVWLARRTDGRFEGSCALKFLDIGLASEKLAERFQREGMLLGRLAHPNIARLLDAGTVNGRAYLALEYVEGERIDRYCEPLSVEQRVRLFLDVVAAVAHAHSLLIVHRDLKPSNVLVTRDGQVKLLDFGIAKLLHATPAEASDDLTRLEDAALTPEYAAPEQLLGELPTTATDVYQLGMLLHVLLTGHHPIQATGTRAEKIRAALDGAVPRASDLAERLVARQLRGDLDAILGVALRKDPAERYATAQALKDELLRFLQHEPVLARRGATLYRVRKFVGRHRIAVAAAAVAGATLVTGVSGMVLAGRKAALERDRAVRELTYAEAANEFTSLLLSEGAGTPFTTAQLLARATQSVEGQFAGNPELRARLQLVIATQYSDTREFEAAEAVLLRAQASARAGTDANLAAQIDCRLAAVYDATGRTDEARALFAAAAGPSRQMTQLDPSGAVTCFSGLALFHRDQGDAPKAIENAQAALALLASPRPGQRSTLVDVRSILADSYAMVGRRAETIAQYETSLRALAEMGRENTAGAMAIGVNYAVHLSRAGQTRRAAEIYAGLLASDTMGGRVANRYLESNYANLLGWLGRFPEAAELAERARAAAVSANNPRAISFVHLVAAHLACSTGDLKTCETELAAARRALAPLFPPNHRNFGAVELIDARLALARRDLASAREHLLLSLQIYDAATEQDTSRLRPLALLARVEAQMGDRAALEHGAQAVAEARAISQGFAHTEWLGIALLAQGIAQQSLGTSSEARIALDEALLQLQGAMGDDAPPTREARQLLAGLPAQ